MAMQEFFTIKKAPWYDREPLAPAIPAGSAGIDFTLVPAIRGGTRLTVALLGNARIPTRQAQLYGTTATQLMRVVAVDRTNGAVNHYHCAPSHVVPLPVLDKPDPDPPPAGTARTNWVGFPFNLDLPSQLGLPQSAGIYSVFAWMEDVVSPVHDLILDEDKTRPGQSGPMPKLTVNSPINSRRTPDSPERVERRIVLKHAKPEKPAAIARVLGSIGPEVFPKPDANALPRPKYLVVLAITALDHQVAVANVLLPPTFDQAGAGEFDFDLAALYPDPPKPQRVYVVAFAGTTVSAPLVVEPYK
jgi:hypothetical protein